jgi:Phage integrase family
VFTDGDVTDPPPSPLKAFSRLVHNAGVTPIRFHDLRHTHGSLLINEGVPVKGRVRAAGPRHIAHDSDLPAPPARHAGRHGKRHGTARPTRLIRREGTPWEHPEEERMIGGAPPATSKAQVPELSALASDGGGGGDLNSDLRYEDPHGETNGLSKVSSAARRTISACAVPIGHHAWSQLRLSASTPR